MNNNRNYRPLKNVVLGTFLSAVACATAHGGSPVSTQPNSVKVTSAKSSITVEVGTILDFGNHLTATYEDHSKPTVRAYSCSVSYAAGDYRFTELNWNTDGFTSKPNNIPPSNGTDLGKTVAENMPDAVTGQLSNNSALRICDALYREFVRRNLPNATR
jgi:hypothetical protein